MQQSTSIARRSFVSRAAAALAATFGIAGAACAADDFAMPTSAHSMPAAVATQADGRPRAVDGFGMTVANEALDRFRGGDAITDQDVDIRGEVDGNSANRIVSGDNGITGAFGNAAGITTVIQNSGSNVLIQSGMNVNVQFVDPGQ